MKNLGIVLFILLFNTLFGNAQNKYIEEIEGLSKKCKEGKTSACDKIKYIALNDKDFYMKELAVEKITDQNFLNAIAIDKTQSYLRIIATKNMTDQALVQSVLKDVAINTPYDDDHDFMRMEAIKRITDQSVLKDIALNVKDLDNVRIEALKKVTDQTVLKNLALNDEKADIRIAATENLNDQDVLIKIATNSKYYESQHNALRNIANIDTVLINRILLNNNYTDDIKCKLLPYDPLLRNIFRKFSIDVKISDYTYQYEKNHTIKTISYLVNIFIDNQLAFDNSFSPPRPGQVEFFESETQKVYYGVININSICCALLSNFSGNDILLIFNNSIFENTRIACVKRITDKNILVQIALNDKDTIVRLAATEQLKILKPAKETSTFQDVRDGKVYKTVKIGEQWMMAENFAYKPAKGKYWAFDNDPNNVAKYGYLYDFETAQAIVPIGWHIPTKEDWGTLKNYLQTNDERFSSEIGNCIISDFNAMMGGYYIIKPHDSNTSSFSPANFGAYFWSSTNSKTSKLENYSIFIDRSDKSYFSEREREDGLSIRLFRDN